MRALNACDLTLDDSILSVRAGSTICYPCPLSHAEYSLMIVPNTPLSNVCKASLHEKSIPPTLSGWSLISLQDNRFVVDRRRRLIANKRLSRRRCSHPGGRRRLGSAKVERRAVTHEIDENQAVVIAPVGMTC